MTREEAVQIIEKMPISHECREFFGLALEALRQPEIVRCKDCKWFYQPFVNEGMCIKHDHDFHDTDWYCADGERKEE